MTPTVVSKSNATKDCSADVADIMHSGLFDLGFYSAAAQRFFVGLELAIEHYLQQGSAMGLNPGRYFDTAWYLITYSDVARSRMNPLLHFVRFGYHEGRSPRPVLQDAQLAQIDRLIEQGEVSQATDLLNDMSKKNGFLLSDAVALRRLKLAYYRDDVHNGMLRIAHLRASWQPLSHPIEYQELLKIQVYWLAEQGDAQTARGLLRTVITQQPGWSCYLEWYKDFVENDSQLAEYYQLLHPFMSRRDYASAQAQLLYATAAKRLFLYDEASRALEQRWHILQRLYFAKALPLTEPSPDWARRAKDALRCLQLCFAEQKQVFFLISGTLLGCVRDKAILPHDKDIDVGVFADTDLQQMRLALRQFGCFLIKHQRHAKVLQLKHINGVLIDIFVHWEQDGYMVHAGQKTLWRNTLFSLQQTVFLDEQYWIPALPEHYLTENYGDWQQPKTDYDTFADTPNMQVLDERELQFHYLKVLPEHLVQGRLKAFQAVWQRYSSQFKPAWLIRKTYYHAMLLLWSDNTRAVSGPGRLLKRVISKIAKTRRERQEKR